MSTALELSTPAELLDIRTGELVPATPENAATLLAHARFLYSQLRYLTKDCTAVLLEEAERQGKGTIELGEQTVSVVAGSPEWDVNVLMELIAAGLPDERWEELYPTTITRRVDAKVANQLERSNPRYAEIIARARTRGEKKVSLK